MAGAWDVATGYNVYGYTTGVAAGYRDGTIIQISTLDVTAGYSSRHIERDCVALSVQDFIYLFIYLFKNSIAKDKSYK